MRLKPDRVIVERKARLNPTFDQWVLDQVIDRAGKVRRLGEEDRCLGMQIVDRGGQNYLGHWR